MNFDDAAPLRRWPDERLKYKSVEVAAFPVEVATDHLAGAIGGRRRRSELLQESRVYSVLLHP